MLKRKRVTGVIAPLLLKGDIITYNGLRAIVLEEPGYGTTMPDPEGRQYVEPRIGYLTNGRVRHDDVTYVLIKRTKKFTVERLTDAE